MKVFTVLALPLVLMLATSVDNCEGQGLSWDALVPALRQQITNLWQNHELQFLGYQCFYYQKPKISKWKLYHIGSFVCPTWTRVKGTSRTKSQSGAMTDAIEDFLTKIRARNLVTEEEAQAWLNGFK